MSDMTTAIWQGFQMGHLIDQEKRLQEVAALQMEAMRQKQLQEAQMRQAFQDVLGGTYDPNQITPSPIRQGAMQLQEVPQGTRGSVTIQEQSPEMQSFLSQFPQSYQPFAERAAKTGMWEQVEKIPKLPVESKYMNVPEGGVIIEPKTGREVYRGQPKSAGERPAQIGLDPNTHEVVYRHPASGMMYTEGQDEFGNIVRKPYKITQQLKAVVEPAPMFQILPGYQTPQGQPVTFSMRTGKPTIGGELQKTPSESDVAVARQKVGIDSVIDEISTAFKRAEKSLPTNAGERITGYPIREAKVKAQTDSNLVLADSLSKGFLAKFARAAGEVGVLTDRDIVRAEKLAVTIHDTPQVREGKLKGIKNLFNEIYERGKRQQNPLGNAPGYPNESLESLAPQPKRPSLSEIFGR